MKLLVNFNDYLYNEKRKKNNLFGGVGYYRQIKPSECIKDHEVKVVGKELLHFGNSLEEQWTNIFTEYDAFWTSYFSSPEAGVAVIYHAQKFGKKFILDIDDNYFDIEKTNPTYEKFKPGTKDRAFLSTILSFADAITVSTQPLKEKIAEHIKTVHGIEKDIYVIPNMNDVSDWNYTLPNKDKNKVVIGYTGSSSHLNDLQMVLPYIREVMAKHKHVHFEIMGITGMEEFKKMLRKAKFTEEMAKRIAIVGTAETWNDYTRHLLSQPWDIGIAPLVDNAFNRCKSHIKFMEYSMMKIPVVASRVYPYLMDINGEEVITDGETGFLCTNDWVKVLEKLVLDKELRGKVGLAGYEHVKNNWQYKDSNINEIVNKMLAP